MGHTQAHACLYTCAHTAEHHPHPLKSGDPAVSPARAGDIALKDTRPRPWGLISWWSHRRGTGGESALGGAGGGGAGLCSAEGGAGLVGAMGGGRDARGGPLRPGVRRVAWTAVRAAARCVCRSGAQARELSPREGGHLLFLLLRFCDLYEGMGGKC